MRQRSRFPKTLLCLPPLRVNTDTDDDDDGIGAVPSVSSIEPPPPSLRRLQSAADKPPKYQYIRN